MIQRSQQQTGGGDEGNGGNGDRDGPAVTNTVARALLLNVRMIKVYELFQGHPYKKWG